MLWKVYDPLGPLWLRVPSFLRSFWLYFARANVSIVRRAGVSSFLFFARVNVSIFGESGFLLFVFLLVRMFRFSASRR